ncbi:MAG: sporulation integral membrane protein YlbJ [Clostridia bacterium]|nr:sporulation integral membrane protein YlbJ [Clostridia bacterium]
MLKKILWIGLIIVILFTIITQPKVTFIAATNGLKVWSQILIPALLPFFIIANLLMSLGFINFLGILLEPLMRSIFKIPGTGGFVMAIGFTSGFPISSLLTADLRAQGKLTKNEAERLMSFTNNASPLFMFSAISIGMFNSPELGFILAGGHYLSNIIIGIVLGMLTRNKRRTAKYDNILKRAYYSLLQAPSLPIGQVMGEAITKGIRSIVTIGGFVLLFAIAIESFKQVGVFTFISLLFIKILSTAGFDPVLAPGMTTGLFEVTLGIKEVSTTSAIFYQQIAVTASILAWSGLSIHAQVANFISNTDINLSTFIYSRLAQGVLAPIITLIFLSGHQTVMAPAFTEKQVQFLIKITNSPASIVMYSTMMLAAIILLFLILSILLLTINKLRHIIP